MTDLIAITAIVALLGHSFTLWVILDSLLDHRGFAPLAHRPRYNRRILTQVGLWLVSAAVCFLALDGSAAQVGVPLALGLAMLLTAGSSRHVSRQRTVGA